MVRAVQDLSLVGATRDPSGPEFMYVGLMNGGCSGLPWLTYLMFVNSGVHLSAI